MVKRGDIYSLTKIIRETYEEGSNLLVAVVADPRSIHKRGVGKSVYALRLLIDFYKEWKWDWLKRFIVFQPQDFLRILKIVVNDGMRIPLIVWDDAGFWLNRQRWNNKFVVAVRENLNVIRTAFTSIVFTSPTWGELAKGIRDHIDIIVKIRRANKEKSIARGYKIVEDVNNVYQETLFEDFFGILLPNEIYTPYEEVRRRYVQIGLRRMEENLEEILEGVDDAASFNSDLDLEDLREMWGY